MQPPRRPPDHLHVVGKNDRKENPMSQYRDMFIGAVVVTIATVTTTLGVHWLANKASRKKEREEPNPQAQLPQIPPGYFPQGQHPFAPSPFAMPPAMPQGGMWIYAPPGATPFGGGQPSPPQPSFPAALQSHGNLGRTRSANASGPPPWFANWAKDFSKTTDERFAILEEQIGAFEQDDGEEGEYEDVG
jgi:hypothetical protein